MEYDDSRYVGLVVGHGGGSADRGKRSGRRELDPASFAAFYERIYPRVLRYFQWRTRNPQQALDLTAETFAIAFEARSRFRGHSDLEAVGWVFAIARAQLQELRRRGAAETAALDRLRLVRPPATDDDLRRVESLIDAQTAKQQIEDAFDELPPEDKLVLQRYVIEERDHAAIAEELGIRGEAVRAKVSRGLRKLARNQQLRMKVRGDLDG